MKDLNESRFVDLPQAGERTRLVSRVNEENPNHHLWNNRGTWWCHFTVHREDYTSERIRVSLKTREVETARQRRDQLLRSLC
ncbi:MAG: hypothetical protein P1U68_01460 [Verrucomicrobiales bacterium]|nr:hypothetical protein [Verrucomicrobiales bacterium]